MKILLYLSLLLFFGYLCSAQITLTAATSNPLPGDTVSFFSSDTANPGSAGANVTWDFSNLSYDGYTRRIFGGIDGPASCHTNSLPLSYWEDQRCLCSYINYSSDSLIATGGFSEMCMGSYQYYNAKQLLHYPLSYNGPHYYDSFKYFSHWHSGSVDSIISSSEMWADGYGTLILPDSIYHNVLRVKKVETGKHREYINFFDLLHDYDYVDEYYEWYSATAQHSALLIIHKSISATGLNSLARIQDAISVYPIPAQTKLFVSLPAGSAAIENITLTDITGRQRMVINNKQGLQSIELDVSSLPDGVYVLRAQTSGGTVTKKVEIMS